MTTVSAPEQPTPPDHDLPTRDRLLEAAISIFVKKGYGGASVREICELAATSSNMIHHYFGSKQGLYDEVLSGFSERVLLVPIRIISTPPRNRDDLISRIEIFVEETLEALISQRLLFELIIRERTFLDVFTNYYKQLIEFLEFGKKNGLVRNELDTEMVTGLILDRLGNQILFSPSISQAGGPNILNDSAYKKRWLRANLDLIFNGILTSEKAE